MSWILSLFTWIVTQLQIDITCRVVLYDSNWIIQKGAWQKDHHDVCFSAFLYCSQKAKWLNIPEQRIRWFQAQHWGLKQRLLGHSRQRQGLCIVPSRSPAELLESAGRPLQTQVPLTTQFDVATSHRKAYLDMLGCFLQTFWTSDLTCCSGGFILMNVLKDVLQSTPAFPLSFSCRRPLWCSCFG